MTVLAGHGNMRQQNRFAEMCAPRNWVAVHLRSLSSVRRTAHTSVVRLQ
jgi:hypothetical protein